MSDDAGVTRLGSDNFITMGSAPSDPPAPRKAFDPGAVLGPYRIERRLGQGGMGEVYEAEHVEHRRRVALKVLTRSLDSPEATARFLREGRLAAAVSHPNSVYVFGSHEIDGVPMIAMELVAGGTLEQVVERDGPLASARAVDAILQVVDGLEAAHAVGVLHRDIKPSNCFITGAGDAAAGRPEAVKIGDFGLSMSTEASAANQTQLTMVGTFMGTPAYASPEQVSAGDLDVRADIYSVGATLYFLLTGQPPFGKGTIMQVFAAVLREDPQSPRTIAPSVPEPLAAVVLQCLKKKPEERFQTYAALREALAPFSTQTVEAAPQGLRFVAYLGDSAVEAAIYGLPQALFTSVTDMSLFQELAGWTVGVLYFGILEGVWGASLGKRLVGLRVVAADGSTVPGVPRAMARVAVMTLLSNVVSLGFYALYGARPGVTRASTFWIVPANLVCFAALWITARRANGYRAVHELVSGTRTVRARAAARGVQAAVSDAHGVELPANAERIGEYAVTRTLWSRGDETLLAARDEALRREVWIHRVPPGTPALALARQDTARVSRLRVVATIRAAEPAHRGTGEGGYDVYEAVPGAPLAAGAAWGDARRWLADLAEEIAIASHEGTLPAELTTSHVWIGANGQVKLLDFPRDPAEAGRHDPVPAGPRFLGAVMDAALSPDAVLPVSARRLGGDLRRGAVASLDDLRARTKALAEGVVEVTTMRRLAGFASTLPLMMIMFFGVAAAGWSAYSLRVSPALDGLDMWLRRLDRMDAALPASITAGQREAFRIVVGDRYAAAIDDPATWRNSMLTGRRRVAERARRAAQDAGDRGRTAAAETAAPIVAAMERGAAQRPSPLAQLLITFGAAAAVLLGTQGLLATSVAIALGAPAGLRLFGLTVATRDGAQASRARVALRALTIWGPVIAVLAGVLTLRQFGVQVSLNGLIAVVGVAVAAAAAGVISAVVDPSRSLFDRLAGTRVVPL